jgi:uncharacterized radical SAM protein YgiQ
VSNFLPVCKEDMEKRGLTSLDFIMVTGDAYVDHPSFGTAIISRLLESKGYTVGIISQPDWTSTADFTRLGRPNLGFLVNAGNIDSMVAHYTVAKKKRTTDSYSPGGIMGKRPDRAVIVYCNRIREAYRDIPLIIGGIEASLRRFAHYDYWSDSIRRSILVDSGADLLIYGMGERQVAQIAKLLSRGVPISSIDKIPGTCVLKADRPQGDMVFCPSFELAKNNKKEYAAACKLQFDEHDPIRGKPVVQPHSLKYLVCYPPAMPLSTEELDEVYDLPYQRAWHPMYEKAGGVPAISEVEFSIISSRGCFGGCNFCSLAFHQGKMVTARSHKSILKEAEGFLKNPSFKGYISDVGGPTANFRIPSCQKQFKVGMCKDRACLTPHPCRNLKIDHRDYISLLRKLRALDGVKRVFIRSGIRFDYLMADRDHTFFQELCRYHISGQLKVAPEHVSNQTLAYMAKPEFSVYRRFYQRFTEYNATLDKKQYLVPYLMSSHPGCTIDDAIALACYLKEINYRPQQVQDFYPTPGTISTCMYYTGINPKDGQAVYIPRTSKDKALQRALLQYFKPQNHTLVAEALRKAQRDDLIGYTQKCLIAPDGPGERRNVGARNKISDQGRPKGKQPRPKGNKEGKPYSKKGKNSPTSVKGTKKKRY